MNAFRLPEYGLLACAMFVLWPVTGFNETSRSVAQQVVSCGDKEAQLLHTQALLLQARESLEIHIASLAELQADFETETTASLLEVLEQSISDKKTEIENQKIQTEQYEDTLAGETAEFAESCPDAEQ